MANTSEATAVSFRKGTRSEHESFRGVKGEVTVDTTTPTVWVHLGDQNVGTPLAREDLINVRIDPSSVNTVRQNLSALNYTDINLIGVTQEAIASKGIAKSDMSNVASSALAEGREHPLAYADTTNVNTANLVDSTIHTGTNGNKPLAYRDLANVSDTDFHLRLDSIYAKVDMSNMATSSLAENRENALAYADLHNINLQNTRAVVYDQGLQLTQNLVTDLTNPSATTYPSSLAVKNALDTIPLLPAIPSKSATNSVLLTGIFRYEYGITLNDGGTGYQVNDVLTVTASGLQILVTAVDGSGTITSTGYEQQDYYGTIQLSGTGVAAQGGNGTGATFDVTSTQRPAYTNDIVWSNTISSTNINFTNTYNTSDYYIPENPAIGTIRDVASALETLGLNQQKPQITDIVVTDVTGIITVTFTYAPTSVTIKKLIGGTTIAGTWSAVSTTMTFTPTTAADVLNESWIIKPQ